MEIRAASESDWPKLKAFFDRVYRARHPLQEYRFWRWQYGDPARGRSIVAVDDAGAIVGHCGASFKAGLAWIMNLYLDEAHRGKGILGKQYALARSYMPLAATSANPAGLGLYRNMGWIRYANLQRLYAVRSDLRAKGAGEIVQPVRGEWGDLAAPEGDAYWAQPGIRGVRLSDGSTAVVQENVGALRFVAIVDPERAATEAFARGFRWIDYVASWNDPTLRKLEDRAWTNDDDVAFPWKLDPLDASSRSRISFLSEEPIDRALVVDRTFSDHGRVPSL